MSELNTKQEDDMLEEAREKDFEGKGDIDVAMEAIANLTRKYGDE